MNFLLRILLDQRGGTLAITRKTANTLITAAGFNTNYAEVEAEVNSLDAENFADDSVGKAALASDVVRTNYGLTIHTDGSLYVKTYGLINVGSDGVAWGRTGDMLLSSSTTTPDGFSDVSATYADKFIRISSTALSTGGANTHTHTATVTVDSHTLTTAEMPAHTHTFKTTSVARSDGGQARPDAAGGETLTTNSTGGDGGHSHTGSASLTTGDNVPAFFTLKAYQHS